MTDDSPDSEVRQFYADADLSDDRIDAMLSHGRSVADAMLWKRVALASGIGCAVMFCVCAVLAFRLQDVRQDQTDVNARRQIAETSVTPDVPADSVADRYQLVAVRHHGDACPLCRASSEVFAELRETLSDEPIDFKLIDLRQNAEKRGESQDAFDALALEELVPDGHRALVALADPSGELQKLDLAKGAAALAQQISTKVHQE